MCTDALWIRDAGKYQTAENSSSELVFACLQIMHAIFHTDLYAQIFRSCTAKRTKLSLQLSVQRGQQEGKSSKYRKCSLLFVCVYRRLSPEGSRFQITIFLVGCTEGKHGKRKREAFLRSDFLQREFTQEMLWERETMEALWSLARPNTMRIALTPVHHKHTYMFTWHRWAHSTYSSCRLWRRRRHWATPASSWWAAEGRH